MKISCNERKQKNKKRKTTKKLKKFKKGKMIFRSKSLFFSSSNVIFLSTLEGEKDNKTTRLNEQNKYIYKNVFFELKKKSLKILLCIQNSKKKFTITRFKKINHLGTIINSTIIDFFGFHETLFEKRKRRV